MPQVKFERDTQPMDCFGLDLNRPIDSVKPARFPFLQNCRSYQSGRIEPREGLTNIGSVIAGQSPVHSIRRLNDSLNNTWIRVIGAGTHLAYGQTVFTDVDSGYSGDPLALIPWKPDNAPATFMYIGDRSRMRKINAQGSLHEIGWPAPANAPGVALTTVPQYKVVDDGQDATGWTAAGTANPTTTVIDRVTGTTISQIIYDTGTTGWASIAPSAMTGIGRWMRLEVNHGGGTAETVVLQSVFPNSVSTTIASIIYDSGSSGLCSIVFTTPLPQVFCDALLKDSTVGAGVGQYARIVAATPGPDGSISVRVSTSVTWSVGDTVAIQASFRCYLANTHANGEGLQFKGLHNTAASGIGTVTKGSLTLDLSTIATGVVAQPSDYMHISFQVSDPTLVKELKVQLAVDAVPAQDGTNGGFQGNYYFKSFRPADITPAAANAATLIDNRQAVIQRGIINQPNATPAQIAAAAPPPVIDPATGENIYQFATYTYTNPATGVTFYQTVTYTNYVDSTTGQPLDITSLPMGSGYSQWAELIFPISELVRVGTDASRTLANVTAIQIVMNLTGGVTVLWDSWWIGGGYGPDTGNPTASPYKYRYRAREKSTNVPSNWSPNTRFDIQPFRQAVTVTPAQYTPPSGTSLTASDFFLDIERFGGELTDWHYIGTITNGATPSFNDVYDDSLVGGQPIINQDNYQMWPVLGAPVQGTTGIVSGTSVKDSGSNFNTSWAPGTRIIINNIPYTIYQVDSTSLLEIIENAGSQTTQPWRIDEPTILAQPLPVLWEWDGTFFACGDTTNPGRFYYSNPYSETTQPTQYLDLTPPSEPLMNGVQYNVRSFMWSSESFIQILKTGDPSAPYRHEHIPNGKGLFSRWAVTLGPTPVLCFLAKDGINSTMGGSPTPLTDADLYDLFPNEGNIGVAVNGINPPNVVSTNATKLRLHYYDDYLYFDFLDTTAFPATLILSFDLGAATRGEAPGGWFYDVYNPHVVMHYGEEGQGVHSLLVGTVGENLYQFSGQSDDGTAISMQLSTPSRNQGDYRSNKFYGDVMLDCNLAGLTAQVTPYFNRNSSTGPVQSITNSSRSQMIISMATLASASSWQTAQDVAINIVVNVLNAKPFFYVWEPRWTFESAPLAAIAWEISPTTFGMVDFKHFGLCKITHVSSVDLTLTFTVDNVVQAGITIPNSGGVYKQTIFRVPVMKGKLYRIRIASSDNSTTFRLDTRDTELQIKDWASNGAYQSLRVFADMALIEG